MKKTAKMGFDQLSKTWRERTKVLGQQVRPGVLRVIPHAEVVLEIVAPGTQTTCCTT
jgi:hypothetical protein